MTAWQAGDWYDRKAILAIGVAAILSVVSFYVVGGSLAIVLVGAIDAALLFILVQYALRASRYWPIWFAAFHSLGLTLNLLRLVVPNNVALAFEFLTGICLIAALGAMVFGLLADQKRGIANTAH